MIPAVLTVDGDEALTMTTWVRKYNQHVATSHSITRSLINIKDSKPGILTVYGIGSVNVKQSTRHAQQNVLAK